MDAWQKYALDCFKKEEFAEVGCPLQKIASWYWIGSKTISENELAFYNWEEDKSV